MSLRSDFTMSIEDYKRVKEFDKANGTENVKVVLINGTPAIRIKTHDPVTQEYLGDAEEGIDISKLKERVVYMQKQIDNLNELIADAKALIK